MREFGGLPQRVHLVGIGGAGMSGLARCLLESGHKVSGTDLQRNAETDLLRSLGATIFFDHSGGNLTGTEVILASDAISTYNPELEEAQRQGIPIIRRAEALDRLVGSKIGIFVAGSHGKSTTSSMIAKVLDVAGSEPSFVIGASVPSLENVRARIGRGDHFVAEACEAFQNLAHYYPRIAVITNIDNEHLEHYGSQEFIDKAFLDFARRASPEGRVIVNGDDAGVRRILASLDTPIITFGISNENDVHPIQLEKSGGNFRFGVSIHGRPAGNITLRLPGQHVIQNALACIAACQALNIPFECIAEGLAAFTGVSRRWEDYGVINGVHIVDDYAHHPAELAAAVETARSVLGSKAGRLVVAFQPQLFTRTRRLYREFADVLLRCDYVMLLAIDPGGEHNPEKAQSNPIFDELRRRGGSVEFLASVEELVERAPQVAREGDLLLVAGAGSIRSAAPQLTRKKAAPFVSRHAPGTKQDRAENSQVAEVTDETVVALFCDQAHRHPDVCALSHAGRAVSYRELDETSSILSDVLRRRGVTAGVIVGIRLPPSIELAIAMLAILKAGAVYMPLDVALPDERLNYILTQAGAGLLITSSKLDFTSAPTKIVSFSDLQEENGQPLSQTPHPSREQGSSPSGNDAAYVCFTSGSTGYPKGVAIRHVALFRLIREIAPLFGVDTTTKTIWNTSISFDVSLAEIWMTLCGGGQLVVCGKSKPLVGDQLGRFLDENAITHMAVTPSVLSSVRVRSLPALKCIICAGEACPQGLVDSWAPGRRFFNAYGPTEATIYATAALCEGGVPVTIGKALNHVDTYVLDEDLKPVPAGEIGELCLGGVGVTDGYLNSEEETKRRFRTLDDGDKRARRIYRSGDLVKHDADRNLLFLGRIDNQIKIRGNRIELEEIEHSVQRAPGIVEAAVCIHGAAPAQELVCFVVPEPGRPFDDKVLTEQLAAWLPGYMLPSRFVPIEEIPHTASGKKDRRSLLTKNRKLLISKVGYVPPRIKIEAELADIWKSVLETNDDVGMYDQFAQLGGDSLKSLMLVLEIEQRFKVSIPPGYFGRISTVGRMAVQFADLVWTESKVPLRSRLYRQLRTFVKKQGWTRLQFGELFGVPNREGFRSTRIYNQLREMTSGWPGKRLSVDGLINFLGDRNAVVDLFVCLQVEEEYVALSRHLGKGFRVHAMRSGYLVMDYSDSNVERLASHYVDEIDQIKPSGKLVVAGVCQGCTIAHAVARQLRNKGHSVPLLALIEAARPLPFDGNVAFFYSEDSPINPKRSGGFGRHDEILGGRFSVDFLPGQHGSACIEPFVQILASQMKNRLEPVLSFSKNELDQTR